MVVYEYRKGKGDKNMSSAGIKADVKAFLKAKHIKTIVLPTGKEVKLQNAKTSDLISYASKLEY